MHIGRKIFVYFPDHKLLLNVLFCSITGQMQILVFTAEVRTMLAQSLDPAFSLIRNVNLLGQTGFEDSGMYFKNKPKRGVVVGVLAPTTQCMLQESKDLGVGNMISTEY